MIKSHYENVTERQRVTDSILCNKCGESVVTSRYESGEVMATECAVVSASWGFCSKKDMVDTVAHLCEKCHDEICAEFKIPVTYIDKDAFWGMAHQAEEDQAFHNNLAVKTQELQSRIDAEIEKCDVTSGWCACGRKHADG